MKAIQIRYLPATNFMSARLRAWTEGKNNITIPYPDNFANDDDRNIHAALGLMQKMNWNDVEISGTGYLPNGDYVVTLKNKIEGK